jgi:hypothetical protein
MAVNQRAAGTFIGMTGMFPGIPVSRKRRDEMSKLLATLIAAAFAVTTFSAAAQAPAKGDEKKAAPATPATPAKGDATKATPATPATPAAKADAPKGKSEAKKKGKSSKGKKKGQTGAKADTKAGAKASTKKPAAKAEVKADAKAEAKK